jgi:hypothetical protein
MFFYYVNQRRTENTFRVSRGRGKENVSWFFWYIVAANSICFLALVAFVGACLLVLNVLKGPPMADWTLSLFWCSLIIFPVAKLSALIIALRIDLYEREKTVLIWTFLPSIGSLPSLLLLFP